MRLFRNITQLQLPVLTRFEGNHKADLSELHERPDPTAVQRLWRQGYHKPAAR